MASLSIQTEDLNAYMYLNKLLARTQELSLTRTKLLLTDKVKTVFNAHKRVPNWTISKLALRNQSKIDLQSVSFRKLTELAVIRSTLFDIDDASLTGITTLRTDDMSLVRRVLSLSKVLDDVRIINPTDAATMHYETKGLRLSSLAFNTEKVCIVDILNSGQFDHVKETTIFALRPCNCYRIVEPKFPVPDARTALLNSDD